MVSGRGKELKGDCTDNEGQTWTICKYYDGRPGMTAL